MKHRNLRIAWSVAWGIVAVLLIALWVRSCWTMDSIAVPVSRTKKFDFCSMPGACGCGIFKRNIVDSTWYTQSTDEYRKKFDHLARYSGNWGRFDLFCERIEAVIFPDWFLIGVATVLSACPMVHWSRRFSLRTLLIAITLVAVGLGLVVWLAH
jgi:hypothetical protein